MKRSDCSVPGMVAIAAALHFVFAPAAAQESADPDDSITLQQYAGSLRGARDGLIAAGDFEAALEPAEIVVATLAEESEAAAAADRIMLAVVLAELGRFDEAETGLLAAIATLQDAEGQFTETTVTPLRLLGRTYIRARRFPQAITALTEARSISRRNAGLFNVEQADILDDLTTAHLGLGDTQTARDLQIERLETAQRQFGASDPRVIPYHYHLADYYERSRLLSSAGKQYADALAIAEAADDAEQVLIALRNTVANELRSGDADGSLERLRELVATADVSAHELGLAWAVLGDAAIVAENPSLAASHYAEAWRQLAAGGNVAPAAYFADPAVIRFVPPASDVDLARRSLPYAWGTIAIEFDVDEHGRVESINSVGAQPTDLMEAAYAERLETAWFRPALSDGRPVAAENVVLTHYFRYFVEPDDTDD